jgi:REP element-mobilizing transposase RayT
MTDYRRVFVAGGCYFFALVTQDRRPLFADADKVARLREGFRRVKAAHPFEIDAAVILPDPLHPVWRLPEGDMDYPLRWRKKALLQRRHGPGRGPGFPVQASGEGRLAATVLGARGARCPGLAAARRLS